LFEKSAQRLFTQEEENNNLKNIPQILLSLLTFIIIEMKYQSNNFTFFKLN